MQPGPDELAGAVDVFGGLTREELAVALGDLAARSGDDADAGGLEAAVDEALERYYLLEVEAGEGVAEGEGVEAVEGVEGGDDIGAGPLLVPGPAALPRLPPGGEDLPHLLDLEPRAVDREAVARAAEGRLRADAAGAIASEDAERAELLLDACYEVEAWGPVDLADAKAGLADVVD